MKIKKWFFNKIDAEAKAYKLNINIIGEEGFLAEPENKEYVEVAGTLLRETEKAVKYSLYTGAMGGSRKGWTTWIPKSVIKKSIIEDMRIEWDKDGKGFTALLEETAKFHVVAWIRLNEDGSWTGIRHVRDLELCFTAESTALDNEITTRIVNALIDNDEMKIAA